MGSKEREFSPDIETGGSGAHTEEGTTPGRKVLTRILGFIGLLPSDSDGDPTGGCPRPRLVEESTGGGGEDNKRKKQTGGKKAGRPPRPPKGPVLNGADLLLVKELSEIASRRRARIERMKELRRMKETKKMASSSSSSNIAALVITVLFFVVLILQGVVCRMNIGRKVVMGSPAPAAVGMVGEDLGLGRVVNGGPTDEFNGPVPMPLDSWDHDFSSNARDQEGRDIG